MKHVHLYIFTATALSCTRGTFGQRLPGSCLQTTPTQDSCVKQSDFEWWKLAAVTLPCGPGSSEDREQEPTWWFGSLRSALAMHILLRLPLANASRVETIAETKIRVRLGRG
jgi:hypothetical protein